MASDSLFVSEPCYASTSGAQKSQYGKQALRDVLVTDACALCALICHLILKAQGNRSADKSSMVLCGLEVMDAVGQPYSP